MGRASLLPCRGGGGLPAGEVWGASAPQNLTRGLGGRKPPSGGARASGSPPIKTQKKRRKDQEGMGVP